MTCYGQPAKVEAEKQVSPEDKSVYLTQAKNIVKQCFEGLYYTTRQRLIKSSTDIKRLFLG